MTNKGRTRRIKKSSGSRGGSTKRKISEKSPWQVHGGALFDNVSSKALIALKSRLGLNTELKFADNPQTGVALTTTLTNRNSPPTISQGASASQRNGKGVRMTRYLNRMSFSNGSTTVPCRVRCLIVANEDAGVAAVGEVLQDTTNVLSPLNSDIDQYNHFVIYDRLITLGVATAPNAIVNEEFEWTPDNHHLEWSASDTTGLPANMLQGNISVLVFADTANVTFTAYAREEFVDN